MVLSNYKCMHIGIQDPEILIQGLQTYSSNYKYIPVNVSSNRIKIQVILLILQLETDYFSKLFISEIHSKQWHYSLRRDFQNCYSTRRSPTGFFSSNSTRVPIHPHLHVHITLHYIQRILHPESNSTCRRQRAIQVLLLLHTEGKETFIPDSRKEILRIEGKEIF